MTSDLPVFETEADKRIAELEANNARLRDIAEGELLVYTVAKKVPEDELEEAYVANLVAVLAETPEQSLREIQAQAVEDAALHECKFPKGSITVDGIYVLTEYANNLRNQASPQQGEEK